jgi:hypothetical protein
MRPRARARARAVRPNWPVVGGTVRTAATQHWLAVCV